MKKKWWPIRLRFYPLIYEGWKRAHYYWDVYEDGAYEHEIRIGKIYIYFGYPERKM